MRAFMPERSKGLDSSSSIFVCVGSNPTECIVSSFPVVFILGTIKKPIGIKTVAFQLTIDLRHQNFALPVLL